MTEVKDIDREAAEAHIDAIVFGPEPIELAEAFAGQRSAAEKAERDRIVAWIRAGGANVIVETHPAYCAT